jgi:very-long-chain (3R)-3-hydroxyacyl-CoA dehydratase
VRAPLIPTFIQTVAKNLVLWTIVRPFPVIALSPAYTILLTMWSIGEVIRYGYFTLMLSGFTHHFIIWLRYSAFILIYPIGISAEMWLVYKAIGESDSAWLTAIMYGELGLYFPGELLGKNNCSSYHRV